MLNFNELFFVVGYNYLENVNLDGIEFNQSAVIYFISLSKDRLKSVCLDGANLSDFALEFISRCNILNKLDISFCDYMTNDALYNIKVRLIDDIFCDVSIGLPLSCIKLSTLFSLLMLISVSVLLRIYFISLMLPYN